ncbi:hypothetical protein PG999_008598 [Apiospora kogelbergensis]|uniref:SMP-30/Gluconolactonase/LRE-like region domain-containing protein n=1 Tax=Apiospora kogelbergensis TaxID=1337665 RepID=A0AAW0QNQ9_9PEZI
MACAVGSVSAVPLGLSLPEVDLGLKAGIASPSPAPSANAAVKMPLAKATLTARTIHQFTENPSWIENLFVRENGDILMTMMWPKASLYLLKNPEADPAAKPTLIHTFDNAQGLLGITETAPDTFAVISSQFSGLAAVVAGGSAIWEVQLQDVANPKIRKVTDLPEAGFPNGMVKLQPWACRSEKAKAAAESKIVLVSDSFNGLVYSVDTASGKYEVAVKVPEMDPVKGAALPFGVNGIKVMGDYLYWANSDLTTMYRLRINMSNGSAREGAAVETLVKLEGTAFLDEFDVDEDGTIWGVTNADNKLIAMRPQDGSYEVALGSATSMTLGGDTSARFGKGPANKRTLYITTGGASVVPVNGTVSEPAKLVAVDTTGYLRI